MKASEAEWTLLTAALASCLADLDRGEYLIVSHKVVNYFVQFASERRGICAEAVSNSFIEPLGALLSVEQYERMAELGWHRANCEPPRDHAGRSGPANCPNFYYRVRYPIDLAALAGLGVRTLREVYRVQHPLELEYKAFSDEGVQVRFPGLRLVRRQA